MPLTQLQYHILRIIAPGRSSDSYVAGGLAINRERTRFTDDIDIFHDSEERLQTASEADAKALIEAGLALSWECNKSIYRRAQIEGLSDKVRLEWVRDSPFRFFPTQRDELFGYVLHPVDLATNKAAASADRRRPRDIVDLVTIHENILPLGAIICAAAGRFSVESPERMLFNILRHSRFAGDEFRALTVERPIDIDDLHRGIYDMIEAAELFISEMPSEAIGFVFLEDGKPVQPDPQALEKYQRHACTTGGAWPSSREISNAVPERQVKIQEEHPDPVERKPDGTTSSSKPGVEYKRKI